MIELDHLEQYKENNRIEAKKALGGLPHSIWETYSAFANTLGGIILLGVEEYRDKTLHTVNLPDPEKLVREFWAIVNDRSKTSANILSSKDVTIENIKGDHIIVINVPRAQRDYKPVYVDGSPLNAYRRGGEGDYKCTKEEYQAMVRDSAVQTQDMTILNEMTADVFSKESVYSYRRLLSISGTDNTRDHLDDEDLLFRLGAAGIGRDGQIHPTAAGLLMFGRESDIIREYPNYFLDYREESGNNHRITYRFLSASGEWSGNIFDFYTHVYDKLNHDPQLLPEKSDEFNSDYKAVLKAVREALANCLINADYCGCGGITVIRQHDKLTFTNPGDFRIEASAAMNGGFSDPRNSVIMKMFNLIDVCEGTGNGIPNIFYVWKKHGLKEPKITPIYEPNRIELSLPLTKTDDNTGALTDRIKKSNGKSAIQKAMIVEYLTDHADASVAELSGLLDVKASRVKQLIYELTDENIISPQGKSKNRRYKLKS